MLVTGNDSEKKTVQTRPIPSPTVAPTTSPTRTILKPRAVDIILTSPLPLLNPIPIPIRNSNNPNKSGKSSSNSGSSDKPAYSDKLKNGKLTPQERQRRMDNKLCLYCGETSHKAGNCNKQSSSSSKAKARAAKVEEKETPTPSKKD